MREKTLQHCARCGSCTVVCPVYEVTGRESLTARGRLHLLGTELAARPGNNFQDLFASCLLCGACEQACPREINIRQLVVEARSRFPALYGKHGVRKTAVRLALAQPRLLEGLARAGVQLKNMDLLPADSGLRLKLGLLERKKTWDKHPAPQSGRKGAGEGSVHYFSGCLARFFQPSVAAATGRLCRTLTGSDAHSPDAQVCCGLAAWSNGSIAEARRLARRNIAAFAEDNGPILTSCASCSSFLQSYPDLFADDPEWHARAASFCNRVTEFSSFFLPLTIGRTLRPGSPLNLYYHEPCHLRFDEKNRRASLQLIANISAVTRLDSPETQHCCGQGGLFHIGYPELSGKIFSRIHAALPSAGSGMVVTTCSGCLLQWQAGLALRNSPFAARHLAVFLADCLESESDANTGSINP
ncbi:MAG: (Fe-S)-binding protein [Desulfobulbaceae bacterium]|nr:(Fe-S)-binding protein [Desulfobulbaceae bacterium]